MCIRCVADNRHKILLIPSVRKYVEGLEKDSAQLLDLLSATGGDEIEPTRVQAASRQVLYPDVSFSSAFVLILNVLLAVSSHVNASYWCESRTAPSGPF